MIDSDLSPSKAITVVDAAKQLKLSGMSTPSGKRFFDNSMLDVFRVCPRKFYYRHIRNWEPAGIRVPLIFGTGFHAAMDTIWAGIHGNNDFQLLEAGVASFLKAWNAGGMGTQMDFDTFPRTPARMIDMLTEYIKRYRSQIESVQVLEIETAFVVPLSLENTEIFYIGKWDKVYKDRLGINILDHKTSSSFANTWLHSFSPNGQMDGYLHAGHLTYGEEMHGVMIDGALVSKTKIDFMRLPLQRQIGQLNAWLWEVTDLIDQIELNEERLMEIRDTSHPQETTYMLAFPKCTTSCTQYYGLCPYHDLCRFWDNPDQHQELPDGYAVSTWTPFSITENLDQTLKIEMHPEAS